MAKMIIEFTDQEQGKTVSMTNRVEAAESETYSWAVLIGLAIKHLWRSGEIQRFAEENADGLFKAAVADAQAAAAQRASAETVTSTPTA